MESTLPDLTIRQFEYLVAVVDEPTFAIAAQRVGVSPSALSQGLAELERRLEVTLFEPVGRRRLVRESALPVVEHARRVLALTSDLVDWSRRLREGERGRVRIGMIDVAAVVHFTDQIGSFREERPDVDLMLSVAPSAQLLARVRDGELDLAVCVRPPEPIAGIGTEELLQEPLVVIAPPGVEIGPPRTWGPWVTFPTGSHSRRLVADALAERGAPVVVAAESHQPDVLLQMVELGLGWTVLPIHGRPLAPTKAVVGPELVARTLVLARRAGSIRDPAADTLACRLREHAARTTRPAAGARKRRTNYPAPT